MTSHEKSKKNWRTIQGQANQPNPDQGQDKILEIDGPLAWSSAISPTFFTDALHLITRVDGWAAMTGLSSLAERVLFVTLALADLSGRTVTAAELRRHPGMTRHTLDRALHEAIAGGMIQHVHHTDARHRAFTLTSAGRQFIQSTLRACFGK